MTLGRLFSTAGALLAFQGAGAALGVVSVLVLTALLGAEAFGVYAWALSMAGLLGLGLQAGLPMTILKTFAPLELQSRPMPRALFKILVGYAAVIVGLLIVAAAFSSGAQPGRPDAWVVAAAAVAMAFGKLADAVLRSASMPRRAVFSEQVLRVALLLCFILVVFGATLSAKTALAAYAVSALLAGAVFLVPSLARKGPRDTSRMAPNGAHFQVALSRGIGNHLPIFISGFFLAPDVLAYLAIALRLTGPIGYGVVAARAALGSLIAEAVKAKDLVRAKQLHSRGAAMSVGVACAAAIVINAGLYVLQTQFSELVLSDFDDAKLLAVLFLVATLFRLALSLPGPAQMTLVLLDDEAAVKRLNLVLLAALAAALCLGALAPSPLLQAAIVFGYGAILSAALIRRLFYCFSAPALVAAAGAGS